MTKPKKIIVFAAVNIAVSIISILFVFMCVEGYLRIFNPQLLRQDAAGAHITYGAFHRPKPGFEMKTSNPESSVTWKINSKGLRDNEIGYDKPPGTYRILGLGDSFTFGYAVEQEDTFLHKLEALLNHDHPNGKSFKHFETINMGVGGYGQVSEYNIMTKEGLKYKPDMIILAVCVGNDVQESLIELGKVSSSGQPSGNTPENKRGFIYKIKNYLGQRLHTYSFISKRLHKLLVKYKIRKVSEYTVDIFNRKSKAQVSEGWKVSKEFILKIADTAKMNSAEFLVIFIPVRHQVDFNEWGLIRNAYKLNEKDYDIHKPQKILKEFCNENNIDCLDLLRPLQHAEQFPFYLHEEGHFNKHGHKLTAEIIYDHIINQAI